MKCLDCGRETELFLCRHCQAHADYKLHHATERAINERQAREAQNARRREAYRRRKIKQKPLEFPE